MNDQDLETRARQGLGFIPTSGIDGLGEKSREALRYGLQHKLFTQADVDTAQKKYESTHPKK